MTTPTITDTQRLTVLKHLAAGKAINVVATITSLDSEIVRRIGADHGYPDRDKLKWAVDIVSKRLDRAAQDAISTSLTTTPHTSARPIVLKSRPGQEAPRLEAQLPPDSIAATLTTAQSHPSKRVQAAASRVLGQLDKLRHLIAEDEQKNAARRKAAAEKARIRADVERLEHELAAAKAKLRGKRGPAAARDTDGEYSCTVEGCDRVFTSSQGAAAHRRRAHEGFSPAAVHADRTA